MILKCPLNNFFWMTPYHIYSKQRAQVHLGLLWLCWRGIETRNRPWPTWNWKLKAADRRELDKCHFFMEHRRVTTQTSALSCHQGGPLNHCIALWPKIARQIKDMSPGSKILRQIIANANRAKLSLPLNFQAFERSAKEASEQFEQMAHHLLNFFWV